MSHAASRYRFPRRGKAAGERRAKWEKVKQNSKMSLLSRSRQQRLWKDLSDREEERIAIVKKATASGWKSFYKTEKKRETTSSQKSKRKDNNNFKRRDYDMDALERQLLGE